jgi:hypothetical protein
LECEIALADEVKAYLEESMQEGMLEIFPEAECMLDGLVEASSGYSWGEAK